MVVTFVGILDRVPNGRFVVPFGGKLTLFVHVGAADKFYAQIVVVLFGGCYFEWKYVDGSFSVALVSIHNDDLVASVQFVRQLLPERFNSILDK